VCINTKDGGTIGDIEMVQGTQDDKKSIDEPWKKPAVEVISLPAKKGSFSVVFSTEQFNIHFISI
jgi:hypothetical protein